jgi:hypothetical protein
MIYQRNLTVQWRQSWGVGVVTPQISKWEWGSWRWVGGSWRVWFQVFYAVKGRDGNPGPPSFQTRLTPLACDSGTTFSYE